MICKYIFVGKANSGLSLRCDNNRPSIELQKEGMLSPHSKQENSNATWYGLCFVLRWIALHIKPNNDPSLSID